jgi:hypothetical protein
MHRPSAATAISLVALFFAMSGTAYAATGGDFLLGKSNTATAVTSLSNTKGTALSLSSTATTPPLKVSNSVQVPGLNASELDGQPASAFLGATGTAANSSKLGGIPAGEFIQGTGEIADARLRLSGGSDLTPLITAPDGESEIDATCVGSPTDELYVIDETGNPEATTWWNKDGVGQSTLSASNSAATLNGSTGAYVIVVQLDTGDTISTYTLTENYNSSVNQCDFTGQVVTTNG